jgi:5-methylcytosine-specific restriction endonuclease McrA
VDHIRAVVDGGDDSDGNLRLLCQSCHGRRTLEDNR